MPNEHKINIVKDTSEKIKNSSGIYFTNYSGIDVPTITKLRKSFRENDVDFMVTKNTLTKLAAKDSPILRPSHRFAAAQERLAAEAHPREQAPPWVRTHVRAVHLRPRGLVLVQRRGQEAERLRRHEELVVEERHAVAPRRPSFIEVPTKVPPRVDGWH